MEIKGILPETLNDWPGKIPIEIFLGGCNFRCGFCHNPGLVNGYDTLPTISHEQFFEYLRVEKKKAWKDGVIISGGEPTIHKELTGFIKKIYDTGFPVKLDTNGSNPSVIEQLLNENLLDYVAMDIKTDFDNYNKGAGVDFNTDKIKKSVKLICDSGVDYEFRTTCVPGIVNGNSIMAIGEALNEIARKKPKLYVLQQYRNNDPGNENFKTLDPEFLKIEPYGRITMEELKSIATSDFEKVVVKSYD